MAPKTSLGSGSHGFQAPLKASAKPGHLDSLTLIDSKASSCLSGYSAEVADADLPDASNLRFTLIPAQYSKNVSQNIRKDAIRQLYGLLAKAFLADSGTRAKAEEEHLFEKLGLPKQLRQERFAFTLFYLHRRRAADILIAQPGSRCQNQQK